MPDLEGARPRRGDLGTRRRIFRAHFANLGTLFNASTFQHIDALGIRPGWRCWEVGAGGPTVPAWLARRVAPDGYVLATDIDVALQGATDVAASQEAGQRDRLLGTGLLTAAEIDRHLADVAAGRLDMTTFTVVSAWGRKQP